MATLGGVAGNHTYVAGKYMPELIATLVDSLGRLITVSSHCSTVYLFT